MPETIFSRIIRREVPAEIVFEDDTVLAFRDIDPQASTHILVIPKERIQTTNDITESHEQLVGHLVRIAAMIARDEGVADDGYRLVFNCNDDGGQSVDHIHLHLIGGRKLRWPPG